MNCPLFINRITMKPIMGRCDVSFRSGLNIVRAIISKKNIDLIENPSGIRNSVGKTTFVDLVDYALGKETFIENTNEYIIEKFTGKHVLMEFSAFGEKHTIERSIIETDIIRIYHGWIAEDLLNNKTIELECLVESLDGYKSFLDNLIFCGKNYYKDKRIVSYRQIMNYLVRDQLEGFSQYNKGIVNESGDACRKRLEFLLGLTTNRKLEVEELKKQEEKEKKNLNSQSNVLTNYFKLSIQRTKAEISKEIKEDKKKLIQLEKELEKANKEISLLEKQKDSYREQKKEKQRILDSIENDIYALQSKIINFDATSNEISNEMSKLNDIEVAKRVFNPFKVKNCPVYLKEIKSKAHSSNYVCPFIEDDFNDDAPNTEVIKTREKLLKFEQNDINKAIGKLEDQLKDVLVAKESVFKEVMELNRAIQNSNADIITAKDEIKSELERVKYSIKTNEMQLEQYKFLDGVKDNIKEIKNTITGYKIKIEELQKEQINTIEEFEEIYDSVVKYLISKNRIGVIDKKTLEPEVKYTQGSMGTDGGAAVKGMAIIAYDLAILTLSLQLKEKGIVIPYPDFLVHDSPNKNDTDPIVYNRIFDYIIKLEQEFLNNGFCFQYLITTIEVSDTVTNSDEKYIRLELDDTGDGGKLFGFTY